MAKKPTTPRGAKPTKKAAPAKKKAKDGTNRGAPAGKATNPQPHGGAIGNPPFVPTDRQREEVRNYARVFPVHGEHFIARLIGVSLNTLRKYFADDILLGRAQMLAGIGAQMINRAFDADRKDAEGNVMAKGDIDAQKFILARLGGWTTKVQIGEGAEKPFGGSVDLSNLSDEDLAEYGRLAAIAEGLDPEEIDADPDG